jgi:hypothetical protein
MMRDVIIIVLPDGDPKYEYFAWESRDNRMIIQAPADKIHRLKIDDSLLTKDGDAED